MYFLFKFYPKKNLPIFGRFLIYFFNYIYTIPDADVLITLTTITEIIIIEICIFSFLVSQKYKNLKD
ncbi:hypothetical protein AB674_06735 [Flavobacterium sp. ABG]|nr:hypothetical protein AB674_06735 [Flavobacterium sp. ABG]